jgi:spore coat polysaccharide biosynthesis protein SpsF
MQMNEGSKMNYKTNQELFWAGEFGNDYIQRNKSATILASSLNMYNKILEKTDSVHTILELGANIGMNLISIKSLMPDSVLSAVEINEKAVEELKRLEYVNVFHQSILDFQSNETYDFVFTRGVLIHINPKYLDHVYQLLYRASNRYICVAEYYNPVPVSLDYRGEKEKLFKRDFAGDLLDK